MALGIKKITESVIEDGRSLTIIGQLNNNNISFTDNNALPVGAVLASSDGTLRIKTALNKQVKINAATTLQDKSVKTAQLGDLCVTTAKIADSNVTTAKIKDLAVTTAKIANLNVTTAKIADNNVTTVKINNAAIIESKIANSAVTTNKIKDLSVTTAKLAANAVRTDKILDRNVTGVKIALGEIQNNHMAKDSISANNLQSNSVLTDKIRAKQVTLPKLADDVLDYISQTIKNYVDPLVKKTKEELINSIPKNLVQHDGLFDIDGKNGSTSLVNLKCTGDIEGKRVYYMTYQDLAEAYIPGEDLDRGDIVAMHEDGKIYRAESINDCIVGVISEDFANCFGATKAELFEGTKVPVGMIGKVLVKVKGPIRIGQQVSVSLSDSGIGCASNTRGIGQALHSVECDFDEINEVLVQIRPM